MNINTELLEIFGSFEFAAGESQLPSACPGSFGQAGATIDGSWEREVYDALKAAELAVLKEELDKLRPRAAASCAGDPKILEPAKCDDRMDGGLPVFEAINSGNCSDCGGCEPQNDQGNQRYNNAHADSRDELVYVHNTAGPVTSSCPAAHDSSKTVVFELPVELASRSYVYSRGCSLAGGLSVSISTSRAAVVYWCAPGVARVHGNAALELAIDCAKALSVPVLAVVSPTRQPFT